LRKLLPVEALAGPDERPCNLLLFGNSVVFIPHTGRVAFAEHQHTCLNSIPQLSKKQKFARPVQAIAAKP
jgi:hypothetical protein